MKQVIIIRAVNEQAGTGFNFVNDLFMQLHGYGRATLAAANITT